MGSMPEMEIPMAAKSNGRATILAIGTANPPDEFPQVDFADYYFRITNSDFSSPLYSKFKRLCEKSRIRKRHLHAAEEVFKKHPEICDPEAPASLTARQGILATEIPKLGKEAAEKAIKEWGQPKSNITHVIFATNSFADTPAPDQYLVMLLGLSSSVERVVLRQVGCHAGATLIRTAKSIAENYSGARVLVVCADMSSVISFQHPAETNLLVHALFSDGAAAMIVGADPTPDERPIFELVSARQSTIPDTEPAIQLRLREEGLVGHVHPKVPIHLANNIEKVLLESFKPLGVVDDWNSIFWVPHPGGPAILDKIEEELKLEPSKLDACRKTLTEYGNMWGSTVIFALDEMRNSSVKQGKATTGDGLDLGVLFGFGPGVTVETVVLQSVQLH